MPSESRLTRSCGTGGRARYRAEPLLEVLGVLEGFVDLTLANEAAFAGEDSKCRALVADVERRLESTIQHPSDDLRATRRILANALSESKRKHDKRGDREGALIVGPDSTWFRLGEDERVDLSRRRTLCKVLEALVEQRKERPGDGMPSEVLFARAWKGERATPGSISQRIRVAICTLRRLGLRDALIRTEAGYLIDPDRSIDRY